MSELCSVMYILQMHYGGSEDAGVFGVGKKGEEERRVRGDCLKLMMEDSLDAIYTASIQLAAHKNTSYINIYICLLRLGCFASIDSCIEGYRRQIAIVPFTYKVFPARLPCMLHRPA